MGLFYITLEIRPIPPSRQILSHFLHSYPYIEPLHFLNSADLKSLTLITLARFFVVAPVCFTNFTTHCQYHFRSGTLLTLEA